jgi:serine/threonine protein kinase
VSSERECAGAPRVTCVAHLSLVGFYGAFHREGTISIALEYMDGGALSNVVYQVCEHVCTTCVSVNVHGAFFACDANELVLHGALPPAPTPAPSTHTHDPVVSHQLGAIPEPALANIMYQVLWGMAYLKHDHRIHRVLVGIVPLSTSLLLLMMMLLLGEVVVVVVELEGLEVHQLVHLCLFLCLCSLCCLVLTRAGCGLMQDLKPSNILINSKGHAKLSDFGVSAEMRHSIGTHKKLCWVHVDTVFTWRVLWVGGGGWG